jgi:hypothetical protein
VLKENGGRLDVDDSDCTTHIDAVSLPVAAHGQRNDLSAHDVTISGITVQPTPQVVFEEHF